MDRITVLFVCLGNICRSPMAEGVFEAKVNTAGLSERIRIDSAGTSAYHVGEPPDSRMRSTAHQFGLDIDAQRSRQVNRDDFLEFDYIIAMDRSNLHNLQRMMPPEGKAVLRMMREFDTQPGDGDVPDPYYGGAGGFQKVYEILSRSGENFLSFLKQEHGL